MEQKLRLCHPIYINDAEVKEIKFDFEQITLKDRINITKASYAGAACCTPAEFDTIEHANCFAFAAAKSMPGSDPMDFMRLRGKDMLNAIEAARLFFMNSPVEVYETGQAKTSEEQQSS